MNMKIVLLFLVTFVILAGTQLSFAKPQYLENLTIVYGDGSCATCHVDDTRDGPRTPYGTLFENQPGHASNATEALLAIGAPPTATLTPIVTLTPATTPEATTVSATATPKSPGFGVVISLIGLFAWSHLAKRNKK